MHYPGFPTVWRALACAGAAAALTLGAIACGGATHQNARASFARGEQALQLIEEGRRLASQGQRVLALERLNRATTIQETPAAWFEMGRVFEAMGKHDEAATAYQQALKLAPDYQEARFAILSLGYVPEGTQPTENDLQLARTWAAQHAKDLPPAADVSATTQTETAALPEPETLPGLTTPQRMPTQAEVSGVLFGPEAARVGIPSADTPDFPTDKDIVLGSYAYHYRKADQFRRRGELEKAAEEYERALSADPKQIDARLDLGDVMMKTERLPRALFHYERAREEFSDSPRPYLKLGNYYLAIKQAPTAKMFYQRAIAHDERFVEAYNNLAVMAMTARDWDEAKRLLDKIVEIDPSYANAYLNRGIIASDIDSDRAAALTNFKQYVALGGDRAKQVSQWITELEKSGK